MSASFGASVALVLDTIKYQSTRSKLLQFAIDTCLIAHGVRTGYLVDTICPPDPKSTLTALLTTLRAKSLVFKHVLLWHHAPTLQSFFVHAPLLHEKLSRLVGGAENSEPECLFISLDGCLSVSREPPSRLREALCDVRLLMTKSPDAPSLSLSDAFSEEILVPLAAVVIDYPVAYVPTCSTQTSFLDGETLDIYTVSFRGTTASDSTLGLGKEHVLLKFSCPQVLVTSQPELSPSAMILKLEAKFTAILERMGMRVFVTHRTETLDRVAL